MPRGRPTSWVYKIGRSGNTTTLNVPKVIADKIPRETRFVLEVVDSGLLYRFLTEAEEAPTAPEIPWLKDAS